jgi:hypothetical protein
MSFRVIFVFSCLFLPCCNCSACSFLFVSLLVASFRVRTLTTCHCCSSRDCVCQTKTSLSDHVSLFAPFSCFCSVLLRCSVLFSVRSFCSVRLLVWFCSVVRLVCWFCSVVLFCLVVMFGSVRLFGSVSVRRVSFLLVCLIFLFLGFLILVLFLWFRVRTLIACYCSFVSRLFVLFGSVRLICSGLESESRYIINDAVLFSHLLFGCSVWSVPLFGQLGLHVGLLCCFVAWLPCLLDLASFCSLLLLGLFLPGALSMYVLAPQCFSRHRCPFFPVSWDRCHVV